MRFGNDDWDEEFPGQSELWWANQARSFRGKKGTAMLLDLLDALRALPIPRLISGRLADERGGVCAVGALAAYRRSKAGEDRAAVLAELARLTSDDGDTCHDEQETINAGVSVGLSTTLSIMLASMNDDAWWRLEPGERYRRCLEWVETELAKRELAAV